MSHHHHHPQKPPEHGPPNNAAEPNVETVSSPEWTKLRDELAAAKDRALRTQAELENFRKRSARQFEDSLRYASQPLLNDLLPVMDNIERAIEAAEKNHADADALLNGFKMVQQQLEDVLKQHHCLRIEALHQPFDPNVHHAVMQQPSDEHPANTVLMVTQSGYQLHDRVVRPSQVIVSTVPKEENHADV
ncbi:MAG: nucleotide exchange factor GrpE [Planctomycetaceae bacterium]|nr:nucleotide exchange factor GrpE [Planctomycetaceae bacterium]